MCVRSLPHSCRLVGPEIHTVFVDASSSASSTRESEPWYVVGEIVAAATTGASTKVSQRTDMMPACIVLAHSRVAASCSQCNVIVTMGTR
jgi:hypothetical protein